MGPAHWSSTPTKHWATFSDIPKFILANFNIRFFSVIASIGAGFHLDSSLTEVSWASHYSSELGHNLWNDETLSPNPVLRLLGKA